MKTIEVVAGIIKKENKVLIAKRKGGEFDGLWEFPGGKIENNETHQQTLKRELEEELNISVEVKEFLTTIKYQYSSFYLIMHVYNAEIISGNLSLNVHSDLRWVEIKDLDNIEWVPADIEVLHYLL